MTTSVCQSICAQCALPGNPLCRTGLKYPWARLFRSEAADGEVEIGGWASRFVRTRLGFVQRGRSGNGKRESPTESMIACNIGAAGAPRNARVGS